LSTAAALLCWAGFSGGFARAEAPSQAYTCAEYVDDLSSLDRLDGSKLVRSLSAGYFAWGLIPWAKLNPDDPNAAKEQIIREALNACRKSPNAPAIQTLAESVARSIGGDLRNSKPPDASSPQ
jgi:hypothetical protein